MEKGSKMHPKLKAVLKEKGWYWTPDMCPLCCGDSKIPRSVKQGRLGKDRKRVCKECGHTWGTIEILKDPIPD